MVIGGGGGRGQKVTKKLVTSFMNSPLDNKELKTSLELKKKCECSSHIFVVFFDKIVLKVS